MMKKLLFAMGCVAMIGCSRQESELELNTDSLDVPDRLETTLAMLPNGPVKIRFTVTGKYVGILNSYNGAEALKNGVGTHEVYDIADAGGGYVGLISRKNGQFLQAAATGSHYLYANGGSTCDSDWEKFLVEDGIGGGFAFKCKANNKYLNVENIPNMPIRAFADAINTWETFEVKQVVDMWQAVTAFADNFPTKSKFQGAGPLTDWIKYTDEKRNGTYLWQFELFGTDSRYPNNEHPVWNPYSLMWIGEWEVLVSYGTQPKYSPADNPASAWTIPRCVRYLEPVASVSPSITRNRYLLNLSSCAKASVATPDEYGSNSAAYILDLSDLGSQENMGSRWVINLHYRNGPEYFIYDLGPSAGVFAPKYGIVGYDNGSGVWEHYTNIQNQPAHDDIYCLSGVGD